MSLMAQKLQVLQFVLKFDNSSALYIFFVIIKVKREVFL